MSLLGAGLVQHFTDAAGVQGIAGLDANTFEIGQTVVVTRLMFGQGANTFLAGTITATFS